MRQSSPTSAVSPMTMPMPWSMTRRLADGGPGVDLDARAVPGDLGVQPGQKAAVVPPEPVAHPVKDHRVDALVEEEDLQLAPGGRIPALVGFQQAGEAALRGSFLHSYALLAGRGQRKSAPVPRKVREATVIAVPLSFITQGGPLTLGQTGGSSPALPDALRGPPRGPASSRWRALSVRGAEPLLFPIHTQGIGTADTP